VGAENVIIQSTYILLCSLLFVFCLACTVWQDKPKGETEDKLQGKTKGVSGLASLMAYEGDSDDST
jgi:hypothetical protein